MTGRCWTFTVYKRYTFLPAPPSTPSRWTIGSTKDFRMHTSSASSSTSSQGKITGGAIAVLVGTSTNSKENGVQRVAVSLNGCTSVSSSDLIKLCPRGAYTTARTFHRYNVFEFETHVTRTAESTRLIMADAQEGIHHNPASNKTTTLSSSSSAASPFEPITNPALFRPLLMQSIHTAISTLDAGTAPDMIVGKNETTTTTAAYNSTTTPTSLTLPSPSPPLEELKITVLVTWGKKHDLDTAVNTIRSLLVETKTSTSSKEKSSSASSSSSPSPREELDGDSTSYLILAHVTPLAPRHQRPIKVHIRGAPRHNARAKDSEWVRQRTSLEASKPLDVEEILLMDEHTGQVLEGTQTNVFAVLATSPTKFTQSALASSSQSPITYTLYTAPDGQVLAGTVRRLVLEVCAKQGIPVVLEAPSIQTLVGRGGEEGKGKEGKEGGGGGEIRRSKNDDDDTINTMWAGAFLTSTSRLVLPINEISWPSSSVSSSSGASTGSTDTATSTWKPLPTPDMTCTFVQRDCFTGATELIARIEALVAQEVGTHSTRVV